MAKSRKQKRINEKPFNFYGIRKTRNPKYMSVSLVREDKDGERQWINVPVNVKNIKIKDDCALLFLRLLLNEDEDEDEDEDKDEDEDEDEDEDKDEDEDDDDLPF